MPEGDTVHKIAAYFRERILGATLVSCSLTGVPGSVLAGRSITDVRAHGKHLFMAFDDCVELRSHLGMHGSWHRYPAGEPWRQRADRASIVLDFGEQVYLCFQAEEVELLVRGSVRERQIQSRLGPDLLAAEVDLDPILRRARELLEPETLVVDLLLDQCVAAGIGNLYKSEVLFLEGISPHRILGDLTDPEVLRLFGKAAELLRKNLRKGPRITRESSDQAGILWVYGRLGRPCLRCGSAIVYERLGRTWRSTYSCPVCQTR